MSLTTHRRARIDAQQPISLRHAGFRPGTLVNVAAVAPGTPVDGKHAAGHGTARDL